jgi:hypothetical protein
LKSDVIILVLEIFALLRLAFIKPESSIFVLQIFVLLRSASIKLENSICISDKFEPFRIAPVKFEDSIEVPSLIFAQFRFALTKLELEIFALEILALPRYTSPIQG